MTPFTRCLLWGAILSGSSSGVVSGVVAPRPQTAVEESVGSEADEKEAADVDARLPALANPILREYFERQALVALAPPFHDPRRSPLPGRERFVESYVERQIRHFVERLKDRMDSQQRSLLRLREYRERGVGAGPEESESREHRALLREELRRVEGNADEMRRMLAFVFLGLNTRDRLQASVDSESRRSGYLDELKLLEKWIEETDREISHYLFVPSNVVTVESLQEEGMLVLLQRTRDLSRKIREDMEREGKGR